MKFIHTADIHLGSQLKLKTDSYKINERKNEVRATFKNIVELAKRENARAIILAGDVFDGERALKKDKEFFYSVVKNNPDIDFLYLRGNHDILEGYSESYSNLKLFSDEWKSYNYGEVEISGIEMTSTNSASLYSTLNLDSERVNICILHGQVADSYGKDLINLSKLKEKNIDYLALGHIHSYKEEKIDDRGRYAYSGCPEGRGYDETGKKGVVLLEVEEGKVLSSFIPMAIREISNLKVDCSNLKDSYEVYNRIKQIGKLDKNNLYRIELYGEVDFDTDGIENELIDYLSDDCYLLSVKDKLLRRFNVESLSGDISLKGEFLRKVLSSDLSDEEKSSVISVGLKALSGREI